MSTGPPSAVVGPPMAGGDVDVSSEPAAASTGGRRRTLLVALAAVAVVAIGSAAWAAFSLVAGTPDQLAARVPADTTFYLHVNLDPSAGNKLGLVSLADRINDAAGEDLISLDSALAELDDEVDTDGIDFARDIAPWLGSQFAVWVGEVDAAGLEDTGAALDLEVPELGDVGEVAVLVAVDDEDGARSFLDGRDELVPWEGPDGLDGWQQADPAMGTPVVVTIDDGVLVAGTEPAATRLAAVVDPLGESDGWTELSAELPDGVVTAWVDTAAWSQALGQANPLGATADAAGAAMGVLSFEQGRMRLAGAVHGADDEPRAGGIAPVPLEDMPADGQLYVRYRDTGRALASMVDGLAEVGTQLGTPEMADEVDAALEPFGTSVDEISGWLGDISLAAGFDPGATTDNLFVWVHAGTADEAVTRELVDEVMAQVPPEVVQELELEVVPGAVALGDLSVEVVDGRLQLHLGTAEGRLADDPGHQAAVDGLPGETSFYLDLRSIVDAAAGFAPPDDPDVVRTLRVASAFDAVVTSGGRGDDGVLRGELAVTWGSPYEPVAVGGVEPALPDVDLGALGTIEDLLAGGGPLDGGLDPIDPLDPGGDPEVPAAGGDYGDDPDLDALWDDCATGDLTACDDLYLQSPIGSAYEDFGATCGRLDDAWSTPCADQSFELPPLSGGATYGDDPELDVMWDACDGGDLASCDDLYVQSPLGSDYEDFGATCGRRSEEPVYFCDELGTDPGGGLPTPTTGDVDTLGDDPDLDALWTACETGELAACDDLFVRSPIGSDYEEFGLTCGRRSDIPVFDCQGEFG